MTGDLAALQGSWKITALTVGGAAVPAAMIPDAFALETLARVR